jgi:hypothetical protein
MVMAPLPAASWILRFGVILGGLAAVAVIVLVMIGLSMEPVRSGDARAELEAARRAALPIDIARRPEANGYVELLVGLSGLEGVAA